MIEEGTYRDFATWTTDRIFEGSTAGMERATRVFILSSVALGGSEDRKMDIYSHRFHS